MSTLRNALVLGTALITCSIAWGHHSFAMFDLDKEVTSEGLVKEFQWTNPHVWLQVLVSDGKGGTSELSLEMGAPGMLTRTGWKSRMLKANDKVTVAFNPLKSGGPRGRPLRGTFPDGGGMGPGGPPPPLPAKQEQ